MKRAGSLLVALLVVFGVTGCAGEKLDSGPDPKSDQIIQPTRVRVVQMPDNFRNVAMACDGPMGIYVTSRGCETCTIVGSALVVIPNDPRCAS